MRTIFSLLQMQLFLGVSSKTQEGFNFQSVRKVVKSKKKKVAFPRRTWQIIPVTRRLVGTPRCGVRSAQRADPAFENLR
jgi:hypothetical protein